jgi:DNA repair exonuclease SbcCD ATPase subunit
MSRVGIDYGNVKQAALQLLAQGEAPSVQKIREILGTGSHTTIAGHLKNWRDDHAQKVIRHLPATLPVELISGMEILWQTAMEKACEHLAQQKGALDQEREALAQTKREAEKIVGEIKEQMAVLTSKFEALQSECQQKEIELAVAVERLEKQGIDFENKSAQHEERLQRAYAEKEAVIEKNNGLEKQILSLQEKNREQAQQNQQVLTEERARHEQSENRWLKLIDAARQESKELQKRAEKLAEANTTEVKSLNKIVSDLRQQLFEKERLIQEDLVTLGKLKEEILTLKAGKLPKKSKKQSNNEK